MSARISVPTAAPDGYQAARALERYLRGAVDGTLLHLLQMRASMLNGCTYCVDLHSREAQADGEDPRRLFAVAAWPESPFFDERERAALALTDAVTRLDRYGVPDEVWDTAARHWSEPELANLVLLIGTINLWNRIAITSRTAPPPLR